MAKRKRKPRKKEARPGAAGIAKPLPGPRPARLGKILTGAESRNLLAVLLLAFAARIVFFLLNRENNPLFHYPIMDALYHDQWARRIADGDFWGDEVFFRAPLYPYFLALLYKAGGLRIDFALFVQHLIGTASAGLVYLLCRLYFSRPVALVAGIVAALYWPFMYFEGQLLIVTLIVFLDLAFLVLLTQFNHTGDVRFLAAAGAVFGLSAIARPNILVVFPIVPLALYLGGPEGKRLPAGKIAGKTLVFLAFSFLFIVPVIARNYIVGGDLVPIASQGGVNFYIGNNPRSDGRTAIVPGTRPDWWGGYYDAIAIAEKDMGRKLKPSEISNYYFRKGLSFILREPAKAAGLMLHKTRLFFSGGERSNNMNIYFFWRITGMGGVPLPGFWFVCPLGLAGMILLWRKRRELVVLYFFLVSYAAGVIAFFVNARFRLPVVPILIVFAAWALVFLYYSFKNRDGSFPRSLAVVLLCFIVVDSDFITFKENKVYADSFSHYTLGNAYLKMGKTELAFREYEKSYEIYEKYPVTSYKLIERNVHNNLGIFYHKRGECTKAIPHLEKVGGSDEYALRASRLLAECYSRLGRVEEAVLAYRHALRMKPDDRESLVGLASLLIGAGRYDEAGRILDRAESYHPGDASIRELRERMSR